MLIAILIVIAWVAELVVSEELLPELARHGGVPHVLSEHVDASAIPEG